MAEYNRRTCILQVEVSLDDGVGSGSVAVAVAAYNLELEKWLAAEPSGWVQGIYEILPWPAENRTRFMRSTIHPSTNHHRLTLSTESSYFVICVHPSQLRFEIRIIPPMHSHKLY